MIIAAYIICIVVAITLVVFNIHSLIKYLYKLDWSDVLIRTAAITVSFTGGVIGVVGLVEFLIT